MTQVSQARASAGHAGAEWLARAIAVVLAGFVVWTSLVGTYPNIQQRALVLVCVLAMGFLLYPAPAADRRPWLRLIDVALFAAGAAACGYVIVNYFDLMMYPGTPSASAVALGIALGLALFELARRTVGWSFAILMLVFTGYALWGHHIPGRLGHAPFSAELLVDAIYLGTDGLWGGLLDVYASLLILFILFSGLMMATGAGQSFIDIGKLIAGRHAGGPAKIAVVTSALIGSVTGSSVTNVAMTGAFTIPMMKRMGYRPAVAAAIEATASSGGQITPPMMGAGLFLMAELLGIGITRIMLIAAVPALLFYIGLLAAVHFESRREGIVPVPDDEMPDARQVLSPRAFAPVLLPFVFLVAGLVQGYSAQIAILMAIAALVGSFLLAATSIADAGLRLRTVALAIADCARPLVTMGVLIAAASMVVSVIGFFGVGPKLSEMVLELGQGALFPTLILAGMVVIVVGMGVPTTAAYVLGASVIALALQRLGFGELSSHLFIFYFATLSAITPPVCAAVFVAADIARTPWLPVAWQTMRFAVIKYVLPFIFMFHPELLLTGSMIDAAIGFALVALGAVGLSAAFAGFLFRSLVLWQRIVLALGSVLVLWPDPMTSLVGILPMLAIGLLNHLSKSSDLPAAAS